MCRIVMCVRVCECASVYVCDHISFVRKNVATVLLPQYPHIEIDILYCRYLDESWHLNEL